MTQLSGGTISVVKRRSKDRKRVTAHALYFDYIHNGKRVRIKQKTVPVSAGVTALQQAKQDAEVKLREHLHKLYLGEDLTPVAPITVAQCIEEFYAEYQKANRTGDEVIRRFTHGELGEAFGDRVLSEITTLEVEDYLRRRETGAGPASANRDLLALKGLWTQARRRKKVKGDGPFHGIKQRYVAPRRDYLKPEEFFAFIDAVKNEDRQRLFWFLVLTGLRVGSALSLRWRDIDEYTHTVTVVPENSKNKRLLVVPLVPEAVEVLAQVRERGHHTDGDDFVFVRDKKGRPVPTLRWYCGTALEKAGLAKQYRNVHVFRHTTATWLALSGATAIDIMRQLAHSSISQSEQYVGWYGHSAGQGLTPGGCYLQWKERQQVAPTEVAHLRVIR